MEKIVLGLSGGVDSAVSARLLQNAGYEVFGLYLDIGSASARADAVCTAAFLNVPLTVLDISRKLEQEVCAPFAENYLHGRTPNPCVLCNPAVKFAALTEEADRLGAAFVATGHYARTENGGLYRAQSSNDQSYMLCRLFPEQVKRLVLPLGGMEKTAVRALAREFGIPVADKPDSMEICFIPDKDYSGWLARRAALPGPGNFVRGGEIVGRHEGIHRWTVGQRIPGVYDGGATKLYVCAIHPETGEIEVGPDAALFRREFLARDFRWLISAPDGPIRGTVKVRHSKTGAAPCEAVSLPDGSVRFLCTEAVRAPAPGQTAALYDGDRVLGGGFIV